MESRPDRDEPKTPAPIWEQPESPTTPDEPPPEPQGDEPPTNPKPGRPGSGGTKHSSR